MWSQWPGAVTAPMPPMPMTAAPPQPAAPPLPDAPPPPPPSSASGVAPTSFIGPLQPSGSTSTGATIANTTGGNGNPYEQYTAAQYAAMTPEQQYALQQHWQQWQTYQQEYAKWHAQYGEQYKREMAAAAAAVSNPVASTPNAYIAPSYYPQTSAPPSIQQPPPIHQPPLPQAVRPQANSKIMGQPQMYTQPPPAAVQQPTQWNAPKQMPPEFKTVSVNYNQPPPNFNAQHQTSKFNTGNINQEQKLTQSQPHEHKADDTSGAEFSNQWQDRPAIQNKNGSNMWNSNNQKEADEKPNSGILNQWPKSSQNRGKPNSFGNNRGEPNKDGNDAGNLPSPRNPQNFYVSPNKCAESDNSKSDGNGPDNRFLNIRTVPDDNRFVSNNVVPSDFDKDGSNKFGNNNFGNNGPRHFGEPKSFENNGPKSFGNNNGQNPFNKNFGNNRPPNNFGNADPSDFDERKTFGNEPSHNFGRGNGNNCQNSFDNNVPDRFNNSGNREIQGWNASDFNNQPDNNRWDNNRNSNQNFSPGGPNNNFNSGGGGFNRSTGANPQNIYPSGSWQQQNTRKPELDDASFDRMFEQWEKQFEDWKRANINHPDREEYRRYEQEFEKQRRRITERREQMRRRRMAQMGGNYSATTNSDYVNPNQSEQHQLQQQQQLHQQQQQTKPLHQPQQLIQQQQYQQQQFEQQKQPQQSWRQQRQWQEEENMKSDFDLEDQRSSPKQCITSQTDNKDDKSQGGQPQLDRDQENVKSSDEISRESLVQDVQSALPCFQEKQSIQTLKQTHHSTPKNQTFQELQTSQSLQKKTNQGLQQKQTVRLSQSNQTQQDAAQNQNSQGALQKANLGGQPKAKQQQEGQQKQSQNHQGLVQKQTQQNQQQKGGPQLKQNPQGTQQKQYQPTATNQLSNQQQKQTPTNLQQKQNQTKQTTQVKSNQTVMQNSNQPRKQKENEQKSQQQQKPSQQSQQQKQNTQPRTNQTPQKSNLNQNPQQQKQQTQFQVQGNAAQVNTPKLNQLKPLPQRQSPQKRRQAQQQASAANKMPLETNKTDDTKEITSAKPEQQAASGSLLGKRKSRFDPQDQVREKKEAKTCIEVITLDDDDDDIEGGAGNNANNSVNSIFKKSVGIPGLDLVDESESKNQSDKTKSAKTKPPNESHLVGGDTGSGGGGGVDMQKDKAVGSVVSKIPSLFDVVVEKPPDLASPPPPQQQPHLQLNDNVDNSALMAQLQSCNLDSIANVADALKDPQFLQQISLAVARVQGHDIPTAPSPQLLEQLPGLLQQVQQQQQQQQQQQVGNEGIPAPISFAEWQRRKCLASNDGPNMFGPNFGNKNFNDGPNMFNNNVSNNFGNNGAGRYNNFRNDQMMNPNDFNNRRNFGPNGNNNNCGPGFNRGIGPMIVGGGPNVFNKNESFGDNPFRRSGSPPPPVFDDNIGRGRGVFDGSGGGFGGPIERFGGPSGGGFGGPGGEPSNMDFMRRSMGNNNARSVGPEKNEGFYRPIQVFDYQNSSAATPKVIDYGHKHSTAFGPIEIAANQSECNASIGVGVGGAPLAGAAAASVDEYKPVKTFDYGHASNPNVKAMVKNLPALSKNAIKKRNRKKNKLLRQQQQPQPTLKGAYNPQQQQKQQQQQQQTKDAAGSVVSNEATAQQTITTSVMSDTNTDINTNINTAYTVPARQGDKNADLEDISDTDDIDAADNTTSPAAPPPPSMFPTFQNTTDHSAKQLAIFPSTSSANEQISTGGNATHLQMSIPTMENCNTVAIDEILKKPGRLTRPKRICIILRGPPGSGKSHVARLIKEKETEMGGANPRILSIDDYFLIENDYEEKCPKTGKKIPKKEILYEYDDAMEETYMQYLIKSFKKTISDNLYDFIIVDCNNNSLRTLNEFYCHAKDSGFMPYIVDLFCDLETCIGRNPHERSERDIKDVIDNWCETPFHYIKLNVSLLLENVVEMEDVENMATDEISNKIDDKPTTADAMPPATAADEGDDSNGAEGATHCGFLKSKWESDNTSESLARLDGTNKLQLHKRKTTSMADYLQLDDWQPRATSSNGKKHVRWADIEEKRKQEQMRAIGFVVGQTDWKRMMDPNAGNKALNQTKFIERVNKRR